MKTSKQRMHRLQTIKEKYESKLLKKANVIGVGIGYRQGDDPTQDEPALIVSVTHKVPLQQLRKKDRVPPHLEGVPVRVEAVGTPHAESSGTQESLNSPPIKRSPKGSTDGTTTS